MTGPEAGGASPPHDPAARPVDSLPALDHADLSRYSRHLLLEEIGVEGQRRLKGGSVLCVGTGGLGSPLLLYLAAAGVGRIGIVDFDVVDESNLQRQVIHGTSSLGQPKLESARRRVLDINPRCEVELYPVALTSENALQIIAHYDVVVDGTDNFPTRYLVNDACVLLGKPNVYGSIFKFEGQASVFNYRGGPQYRDLYPEPPPPGLVPSCAEGGVLGVLPGVIGCIQATEALKILLGVGETLSGRLLLYDALSMRFRELKLRRDPTLSPPTHLIDYQAFCGIPKPPAPGQAAEASPQGFARLSAAAVAARLAEGWAPHWIDVRKPQEWAIVQLARAERFVPHEQVVAEGLPGIDLNAPILLQCKSGARSAIAAAALVAQGYTDVTNLDGGILGWIDVVEPNLPRY